MNFKITEIKILFSFDEAYMKMLFAKYWTFCSEFNTLPYYDIIILLLLHLLKNSNHAAEMLFLSNVCQYKAQVITFAKIII